MSGWAVAVAVVSMAVWLSLVHRRQDTTRARRVLRAAGALIAFSLAAAAAGWVAGGPAAGRFAGFGAAAAGMGVVMVIAAVVVEGRDLAYTRRALQPNPVAQVRRPDVPIRAMSGTGAGGCRELTRDDLGAVQTVFAAAFAAPVARHVATDGVMRLLRGDPDGWWGLIGDDGPAVLVAACSRPVRAAMLAVSVVAVVVGAAWWLASGRVWLTVCAVGPLLVVAAVLRAAGGRPLLEAAANLRWSRKVDWVNVQLAVAPGRQRRGLGGRLLAEADRRLADRGQTALIVARPGADRWYRDRAMPVAGWPHLFVIGRPLDDP